MLEDALLRDIIRDYLPDFLTQTAKEGLLKALYNHAEMNYYTYHHADDLLQGDGWTHFQRLRFDTGERENVKGIILSNSCDIDQANIRHMPVNLIFVPLVKLDNYKKLLSMNNISAEAIADKITDIRKQHLTSIFFLPKCGPFDFDYVVPLDTIQTMPLSSFYANEERRKIFTLSQAGFYLFLLKLSIHFCRFHEKVFRDQA